MAHTFLTLGQVAQVQAVANAAVQGLEQRAPPATAQPDWLCTVANFRSEWHTPECTLNKTREKLDERLGIIA
jgi:hypothetical protein